jgi:guanylate kinase
VSVGVILHGPPASGKSTVTRELISLKSGFRNFKTIKVTTDSSFGDYEFLTPIEFNRVENENRIVWQIHRYDAIYAIDRLRLADDLLCSVPIVQVGQAGAVGAVVKEFSDTTWVTVDLRCDRQSARARLVARNPREVELRISVWDKTPQLDNCTLVLDTVVLSPSDTAARIATQVSTASGLDAICDPKKFS